MNGQIVDHTSSHTQNHIDTLLNGALSKSRSPESLLPTRMVLEVEEGPETNNWPNDWKSQHVGVVNTVY